MSEIPGVARHDSEHQTYQIEMEDPERAVLGRRMFEVFDDLDGLVTPDETECRFADAPVGMTGTVLTAELRCGQKGEIPPSRMRIDMPDGGVALLIFSPLHQCWISPYGDQYDNHDIINVLSKNDPKSEILKDYYKLRTPDNRMFVETVTGAYARGGSQWDIHDGYEASQLTFVGDEPGYRNVALSRTAQHDDVPYYTLEVQIPMTDGNKAVVRKFEIIAENDKVTTALASQTDVETDTYDPLEVDGREAYAYVLQALNELQDQKRTIL